MRISVVTLGSAGDLHPYLAIARALTERDNQVCLLSQEPHRTAAEHEGVAFEVIADAKAHARTLTHPKLWHPIDGFGVLWRHLAVPAIEPTIRALQAQLQATDEPLTVFASPLAAGARLAKAKWPDRIRLVSGYTAPMGLRSTDDPMLLGAWRVPGWVPAGARGLLWTALDRWKLEPMARPALHDRIRQLGLEPVECSLFGDWLHGPDGGLALYPDWFAPVPNAWLARGVQQVGFPLFEAARQTAASPDESAMFQADAPPYAVVFAGSAATGDEFTDRVRTACHVIGLRVLAIGDRAVLQTKLGSGDLCVSQGRLPQLLAGAAVFVHHGGIGSLAQGVAAGVPQLILASAFDQFENGARLQRLGMGQCAALAHASTSSIQRLLSNLLVTRLSLQRKPLLHSRPGVPNDAVRRACQILERDPSGLDGKEATVPPAAPATIT